MKRSLLVTALLCSLPALSAAEFRFQIPEGFRDLSPGVPDSNFVGVPDPVRAEAQSGKFAAFAMDLQEDGFYENFSAFVTQGRLRLDPDSIPEEAQKLAGEYEAQIGGPVRILESEAVLVQGVPAARLVYDAEMSGIFMRQMQFMIPGSDSYATLTYTATPDSFDRYRPIFEASAQATVGGVVPRGGGIDWGRAARTGLYGCIAGGVIGLIVQLLKKRKVKKRPPMRRVPPRPTR